MHHSSGEYQFGKKGMGLGLCLVKAFVELHGGSVDVDTAPGRGSCFSFTLPRRHPDPLPLRSNGILRPESIPSPAR